MEVIIHSSLESLSKAAAELFIYKANIAVAKKGIFYVALSGGQTPKRTYELLARKPRCSEVPWNNTNVFWSDERYLPQDNNFRNSFMAQKILLNNVPIPPDQIHPIKCGYTPESSADEYDKLLHTFFTTQLFNFDLLFLGLGSDGHIASIFPGTKTLEEKDHWVTSVKLPDQKFQRVTLTLPVINNADCILILVAGAEKADIVKNVLENSDKNESLPAKHIKPEKGEVVWLLDEAAASKLNKEKIKSKHNLSTF